MKVYERLYLHVPLAPGRAVRLPWPMTAGEAAVYVVIMAGVAVLGIGVALWGAWQLIEPSLWRLAPVVVWVVVWKVLILPAAVRSVRPGDVAARCAAFIRQRGSRAGAGS